MNARIIDGKAIRTRILNQIYHELVRSRGGKRGVPGLAIIRVGDDPASIAYIRQKRLAAEELGYDYREQVFSSGIRQSALLGRIRELNQDSAVHGILVQLPLPGHLDADELVAAIDPDKDVDGVHPVNAGRLFQGRSGLRPCTPAGVMRMIEEIDFDLAGKHAVIVGRSNIVGKPMAMLLLAANATATICHRRSDLPAAVGQADLVVVAVGAPHSIRGAWIKPGAVVIDVGINRVGDKLVGDVEFEEARQRASFITPVPGGVGPVTVGMLMYNTLLAWTGQQRSQPAPAPDYSAEARSWPRVCPSPV